MTHQIDKVTKEAEAWEAEFYVQPIELACEASECRRESVFICYESPADMLGAFCCELHSRKYDPKLRVELR